MKQEISLVVIGASAGGLKAFMAICSQLPESYSIPTVFIQHISPDSSTALAETFSRGAQRTVTEIEDKMPIEKGLFVAPAGYHCSINPNGYFSLDVDEKVLYSRPSIDILFHSAAKFWGPCALGILLTGANMDGASGLNAIREVGGLTIVQDPEEAESSTMPRSAINVGAASKVLPLEDISEMLKGLCADSKK